MKRLPKFVFLLMLMLMLMTGTAFSASQQTSSTLASVVITKARSYLNESTASFWTDAEMLVWVSDGTMDIVARTHCLEAVETEALVANQLSYALSDAFILIRAVVYDAGTGDEKGLERGNLQDVGHAEETGEPEFWCQEQDNVVVWPKPDSDHSGAGHNIDVYTITRPVAVAAGDDVLVPACYDRALVLYVVAQGFYKDSQFAKANSFTAEYAAELDRFRLDFVTPPKE